MALSPQGLIKGLVSKLLPSVNLDSFNTDVAARLGSYGELYNQPLVRKSHNLLDEGSYFTTNNAQSGLASAYNTSFTATAPFVTVYNGNLAQGAPAVYLDYLSLVAIVAGACTTTAGYIALAAVVDSGNRYSSGGTNLTSNIVNPNPNAPRTTPTGVSVFAGAVTATAASGSARTLVGVRNIRPNVSSTVINVVGDMNLLNFGSVEGATGSIVIANANIMPQALPPMMIPPGWTGLLYLTYPVMSAPSAATFAPELGFWVR